MAVIVIIEMVAKDVAGAQDRIKAGLLDAAAVYNKDPGTIEWLPVQDHADNKLFTVFEKFDSDEVSVER